MIHTAPAVGVLHPSQLAAIQQRADRLGATDVYVDVLPDSAEELGVRYVRRRPFERIRRITGYLVGDTARWNSAKLAELHDRVTHA